jgi:cation-transporting ATPase 13A1
MLVMFESTVVTQRLRNLKELRSLQTPKQPIMVYRQGKWEQLPGDALLPGDVISIGRPAGGWSVVVSMWLRWHSRLCASQSHWV